MTPSHLNREDVMLSCSKENSETACNRCGGAGKIGPVHVNRGDQPHVWLESMPCATCDGTGFITEDKASALALGARLKAKRVARGESILQQSKRLGLSPAELSGLERGKGGLAAWQHPFAARAWSEATSDP